MPSGGFRCVSRARQGNGRRSRLVVSLPFFFLLFFFFDFFGPEITGSMVLVTAGEC